MVLIAPSLLAADVTRFGDEVSALTDAGADLLHFDVMDGHFVPNLTFGPMFLKALKKHTELLFDVHLMVDEPQKMAEWFILAGADILTFHMEATKGVDTLVEQIKKAGVRVGISIKPGTDVKELGKLTEKPDLILVMSVEPGFGGQKFLENTPERISKIRQMFSKEDVVIEVDGGINVETAKLCRDAGADILVAGTAVFRDGNYEDNIKALKGEN